MVKQIESYIYQEHSDPEKAKRGYLEFVRVMTYKELLDAASEVLESEGYLDYLEYFNLCATVRMDGKANQDIPRWFHMACYAHPGNSEGWYIHVDIIDREGKKHDALLGKWLGNYKEAFEIAKILQLALTARVHEIRDYNDGQRLAPREIA